MKFNSSNIINILMAMLLWCFLLAPRLDFYIPLNTGYISILACFIFYILKFKPSSINLKVAQPFFAHAALIGILGFYYAISAIIYNNNNYFDFTTISLSLLAYPTFGYFFTAIFFNNKYTNKCSNQFDSILYLVIIIALINSIIITLEYLFPSLRLLIEGWLHQSESANIDYKTHPFRLRGITSSGGASLSMFNALAMILLTHLYYKNSINSWFALSSGFFLTLSCIFLGRTGLIISIGIYSILISAWIYRDGALSAISKFTIIFSSILLTYNYIILSNNIRLDTELFSWAFEWAGVFYGDSFSTTSTDDLATMLFLPNTTTHLIFGIGHFEAQGSIFERTDSGYLKTLHALGLPLTIVIYFYIFGLLLRLKNLFQFNFTIFLIITIFAIAEIKEPFLYQNSAARVIFFLIGAGLHIKILSTRIHRERLI